MKFKSKEEKLAFITKHAGCKVTGNSYTGRLVGYLRNDISNVIVEGKNNNAVSLPEHDKTHMWIVKDPHHGNYVPIESIDIVQCINSNHTDKCVEQVQEEVIYKNIVTSGMNLTHDNIISIVKRYAGQIVSAERYDTVYTGRLVAYDLNDPSRVVIEVSKMDFVTNPDNDKTYKWLVPKPQHGNIFNISKVKVEVKEELVLKNFPKPTDFSKQLFFNL